jgi:hypothetical protein
MSVPGSTAIIFANESTTPPAAVPAGTTVKPTSDKANVAGQDAISNANRVSGGSPSLNNRTSRDSSEPSAAANVSQIATQASGDKIGIYRKTLTCKKGRFYIEVYGKAGLKEKEVENLIKLFVDTMLEKVQEKTEIGDILEFTATQDGSCNVEIKGTDSSGNKQSKRETIALTSLSQKTRNTFKAAGLIGFRAEPIVITKDDSSSSDVEEGLPSEVSSVLTTENLKEFNRQYALEPLTKRVTGQLHTASQPDVGDKMGTGKVDSSVPRQGPFRSLDGIHDGYIYDATKGPTTIDLSIQHTPKKSTADVKRTTPPTQLSPTSASPLKTIGSTEKEVLREDISNPELWVRDKHLHDILESPALVDEFRNLNVSIQYVGLPYVKDSLTKLDQETKIAAIKTEIIDKTTKEKPSAVIYNISDSHWVVFVVIKNTDKTFTIWYKDSQAGEGEQCQNHNLENLFKENCSCKFIYGNGSEQTDAVSCGIMALHNLRLINQFLQQNPKPTAECNERFKNLEFCKQPYARDSRAMYEGLRREGIKQQWTNTNDFNIAQAKNSTANNVS